jgi:hypothetical protein
LGLPVLPEVKKMMAGSADAGAGTSGSPRALHQLLEARSVAVARAVTDHPERQPADPLARREILITLGMSQEDRCLADLERMIDLRRHITIVERGGHEPRLEAGEVVDDQGIAIGHQRGDPIAPTYGGNPPECAV